MKPEVRGPDDFAEVFQQSGELQQRITSSEFSFEHPSSYLTLWLLSGATSLVVLLYFFQKRLQVIATNNSIETSLIVFIVRHRVFIEFSLSLPSFQTALKEQLQSYELPDPHFHLLAKYRIKSADADEWCWCSLTQNLLNKSDKSDHPPAATDWPKGFCIFRLRCSKAISCWDGNLCKGTPLAKKCFLSGNARMRGGGRPCPN